MTDETKKVAPLYKIMTDAVNRKVAESGESSAMPFAVNVPINERGEAHHHWHDEAELLRIRRDMRNDVLRFCLRLAFLVCWFVAATYIALHVRR